MKYKKYWKFGENIEKFYSREIYLDFLKTCLRIFEQSLKEDILKDKRFITYLSAGVVYYQLILRNFINVNIKDICMLYHMTEEQVLEYYKEIKNLLGKKNMIKVI